MKFWRAFNVEVYHIAEKENTVADALSGWAYPASVEYRDLSKHGSQKDREEVKEIRKQETAEEASAVFNVDSIDVGYVTGACATVLQENAPFVRMREVLHRVH